MKNAIPAVDGVAVDGVAAADDVAGRIARETLARRKTDSYASEVRRLLDAALEVIQECGTSTRPRVADIVAAAGLSNDAFYRHFPSKDALVATLVEDGAQRLRSYVGHQMEKESTPAGKIRRWVEGVLSQTDEAVAATTLAVLWNGGSVGRGVASGRHFASEPLATLLREPLAELGSGHADLDATLAAHAVLGMLTDHLWQRTQPTRAEIERITEFCLTAVSPRPVRSPGRARRDAQDVRGTLPGDE